LDGNYDRYPAGPPPGKLVPSMKPTIRNKLGVGFTGVLILIAVVAGMGSHAVFSLRASAWDATRVGGHPASP
jgi:hypothetical protein